MNKKRVLVGSPIYQKAEILKVFLESLKKLSRDSINIDYMFVDDNEDIISSDILSKFNRYDSEVVIIEGNETGVYICNSSSHLWNDNLMLKVANYKNLIIDYAIENDYDYLFFVDSDLILHPNIIEHLKSKDKDILSEIFWTKWHENMPLEPNVWLFDEYDLVPKELGEKLSEETMNSRKMNFLNQLKVEGVYEVGGLGACTLISKSALLKGVNFKSIKNLTIHGEDRFFCIRAAVLGIELFVDTSYPAYHIYRESDLSGVDYYNKNNKKKNKITLSMIVKNEENRYLEDMLNSLKNHIDEAVIIDDGSHDGTIKLCEKILSNIPLVIIRNENSMFSNEVELRKKQWDETIKTNPDWILNLDADEIIEAEFWNDIKKLINYTKFDMYCFRLYDMWSNTHYREDEYWNAHNRYNPFLIRYRPEINYTWNEKAQHCGRFPVNTVSFKKTITEFRVKHFGWSRKEDREAKYSRYKKLDPDAIYGIKAQYDSILDINPNLVKWEEGGNCEN